MTTAMSLCDACAHQQLVRNTRGSVFSLCKRHRTEPQRYRKYPPLPVTECPGFECRAADEHDRSALEIDARRSTASGIVRGREPKV